MRFLCWCSAALVVASCGGAKHAVAHDPFAYDAAAPLEVADSGVVRGKSLGRRSIRISFAGVDGARVSAYLVVPRSRGPPSRRAVPARLGRRPPRPDPRGGAAREAGRGDDDDLAAERRVDLSPARRRRAAGSRHACRAQRRRPRSGSAWSASRSGPRRRPSSSVTTTRRRRPGSSAGRGTDVARYWIRRSRAPISSSRRERTTRSCRTRSCWRSSAPRPAGHVCAGTTPATSSTPRSDAISSPGRPPSWASGSFRGAWPPSTPCGTPRAWRRATCSSCTAAWCCCAPTTSARSSTTGRAASARTRSLEPRGDPGRRDVRARRRRLDLPVVPRGGDRARARHACARRSCSGGAGHPSGWWSPADWNVASICVPIATPRPARRRACLGEEAARRAGRRDGVLRRRRDERGCVPRGRELRGGDECAGGVRLQQQPVGDLDADRGADAGRDARRQGGRLRHPRRAGRRRSTCSPSTKQPARPSSARAPAAARR